jgi:hypothetical protein
MSSLSLSFVRCLLVVSIVSVLGAPRTHGAISFPGSGTSALGHPVSFLATFEIASGILTLDLENTSPYTTDAADTLTSFYFDIASGTNRPSLSYESGAGFTYLVRSGTTDEPLYYNPLLSPPAQFVSGIESNLKAVNDNDMTWQFRTMNTGSSPFLRFGIGTVGNSGFSPNGFTPSIVGPSGNAMINFAIYSGGDINPNGVLNYKYLVKNKATFMFSGLGDFTTADILDNVVFGLGTGPDSTITVSLPEPAYASCLAGLAGCGWLLARRKRPARSTASPPNRSDAEAW